VAQIHHKHATHPEVTTDPARCNLVRLGSSNLTPRGVAVKQTSTSVQAELQPASIECLHEA